MRCDVTGGTCLSDLGWLLSDVRRIMSPLPVLGGELSAVTHLTAARVALGSQQQGRLLCLKGGQRSWGRIQAMLLREEFGWMCSR